MEKSNKERYNELSKKGWPNLNGPERVEYSKLKLENKEGDNPPEPDKPQLPKEDVVEIKKSQLDGIMARLNELESGRVQREEGLFDSKWKKIDDGIKAYTATLRALDGNYAIHLKFSRQEFNTRTQEKDIFYNITWLLPNGETEIKEMLLKEFVTVVPKVEVKITDRKREKLESRVGRTMATEVNYSKFKSEPKGLVDMKVTMDKITYKVHLPDGRIIDLDSSKLNM